MNIRAFIAVEIDQPHKQKISDLISHLKKSNADVKWVTENQMHLTLKFLGNIGQDKIRLISSLLETTGADLNEFSISLSKIGVFPDMRRPRVIWIGIEKGAEILKLMADRIEAEAEKSGFPGEKREFKAHLTLGRVRSLKNIADLAGLIRETNFQFCDEIKIDKLILFQSTLTSKGAVYAPLFVKRLGGPSAISG